WIHLPSAYALCVDVVSSVERAGTRGDLHAFPTRRSSDLWMMRPHRQFRCHGGHLFKEWSRYVVVAAGPELELCSGHRTDQLYTVPNDQGAAEPDYRGQIYPRTHVGGGRNAQRTFRHSLCHGGGYGALLRHPFHPFRNRADCVYHCDV